MAPKRDLYYTEIIWVYANIILQAFIYFRGDFKLFRWKNFTKICLVIALCVSPLFKQTLRGIGPYKEKWNTFSLTSKGGVLKKFIFSSGGNKILWLVLISTSRSEMRLFLKKKKYFFLVFPKENPCPQIPFLCRLVKTFLATFREYTFLARPTFGNVTYSCIVYW